MLPARTADTMSDAIAMSSPNGRMSKRAKEQASARLAKALFGEHCTREDIMGRVPQPSERERHLRQAARLRHFASLGMHPRKYVKEAERLEALAALA